MYINRVFEPGNSVLNDLQLKCYVLVILYLLVGGDIISAKICVDRDKSGNFKNNVRAQWDLSAPKMNKQGSKFDLFDLEK